MSKLDRIIGHMVRGVANAVTESVSQERDETGFTLSPKSAAFRPASVDRDADIEIIGAAEIHHVRPRGIDPTKPILNSRGWRFW